MLSVETVLHLLNAWYDAWQVTVSTQKDEGCIGPIRIAGGDVDIRNKCVIGDKVIVFRAIARIRVISRQT